MSSYPVSFGVKVVLRMWEGGGKYFEANMTEGRGWGIYSTRQKNKASQVLYIINAVITAHTGIRE